MRKFFFIFFLCTLALFFLFLFLIQLPGTARHSDTTFGVTFSPEYASSFYDIDWKHEYTEILDDLGVRYFRLSAYWDAVEPQQGQYDFHDLDYEMNEAVKRGAHVILSVGRKLPRWPECHDPKWISGFSKAQITDALLKDVGTIVERYKNNPALLRWQVENEPFFPFGSCKKYFSLTTLQKEIDEVHALDPRHEIVVTDSGEWTVWIPSSLYGDVLGISMYRESWNHTLGLHIPFPIREGWYQLREKFIHPWKKKIIVTELQAEPWGPKSVEDMGPDEALLLMPIEKIQANIQFARTVGFSEVYLWGVEWWYWLKMQSMPEVWNTMKDVFQ